MVHCEASSGQRTTSPMPLGIEAYPGGMYDNSPTFERLGTSRRGERVPTGTAEPEAQHPPYGLSRPSRDSSAPTPPPQGSNLGLLSKVLPGQEFRATRSRLRAQNPG